ncbi:MAG: nitrogen regulation protein NR(II) [Lachnospiraceae bacterium]
MFSAKDYDKLQQIMDESPEHAELLTRLLDTHQMTLSAISHEIRNPLTLIYSTLQLISSQHPEVATFKYWDQLMQDVEYIKLLLEELSSYNNSSKLNTSLTESDTFFKAVSLSFAAAIADTDIEFVSQISPDLPDIICDSVKIRQILLNLLGNAKDAVSSAKSACPRISMEVFSEPGHSQNPDRNVSQSNHTHILVRISDNGCGISPEHLEHIFEPFVTYKTGGTGLGLAIANRIALAHGGLLTATSSPESLTVFTLALPVK